MNGIVFVMLFFTRGLFRPWRIYTVGILKKKFSCAVYVWAIADTKQLCVDFNVWHNPNISVHRINHVDTSLCARRVLFGYSKQMDYRKLEKENIYRWAYQKVIHFSRVYRSWRQIRWQLMIFCWSSHRATVKKARSTNISPRPFFIPL